MPPVIRRIGGGPPTPGPWSSAAAVLDAGIVFPPVVTFVDPNAGRVAGGLAVTITGSQFRLNGDGTAPVVRFGATPATSVVIVDDTTITCLTPLVASPGLVDVSVTIDGQTATLADAFWSLRGRAVRDRAEP